MTQPTTRKVEISLEQHGGADETIERARILFEQKYPDHAISNIKFEWAMPGSYRDMKRYVGISAVISQPPADMPAHPEDVR